MGFFLALAEGDVEVHAFVPYEIDGSVDGAFFIVLFLHLWEICSQRLR